MESVLCDSLKLKWIRELALSILVLAGLPQSAADGALVAWNNVRYTAWIGTKGLGLSAVSGFVDFLVGLVGFRVDKAAYYRLQLSRVALSMPLKRYWIQWCQIVFLCVSRYATVWDVGHSLRFFGGSRCGLGSSIRVLYRDQVLERIY